MKTTKGNKGGKNVRLSVLREFQHLKLLACMCIIDGTRALGIRVGLECRAVTIFWKYLTADSRKRS